ncbi:hypothetical protein CALVIDRAFT_559887 [Calocera viscosa TUFC12733]|uniref:Uncharacterized protein n=1 Tax=Calocera viscosa (strain TUFC12733) TaxID=1330018 RepID=A0A167RTB7_CALVF|nr:hypothetical protein CALVIDRAFT_559887 [Calocera viscosa TUFC12733]
MSTLQSTNSFLLHPPTPSGRPGHGWTSTTYHLPLSCYEHRTLQFVLLTPVFSESQQPTGNGGRKFFLPINLFLHYTADFGHDAALQFLSTLTETGDFLRRQILLLPGFTSETAPLDSGTVVGELLQELLAFSLLQEDALLLEPQEEGKGKAPPWDVPMIPSEFIFHHPRLFLQTIEPPAGTPAAGGEVQLTKGQESKAQATESAPIPLAADGTAPNRPRMQSAYDATPAPQTEAEPADPRPSTPSADAGTPNPADVALPASSDSDSGASDETAQQHSSPATSLDSDSEGSCTSLVRSLSYDNLKKIVLEERQRKREDREATKPRILKPASSFSSGTILKTMAVLGGLAAVIFVARRYRINLFQVGLEMCLLF